MFVAPLMPVPMLLAIPLWSVAIVFLAVMWLVTWPRERACRVAGVHSFQGASNVLAGWLRILLTPWTFFDVPPTPPAPSQVPPPSVPGVGR